MSSTAPLDAPVSVPDQCLGVLFDELAQLQGQRNAIDSRIVEIVAEIDRDGLWGATGARSVESLVAWKTGCSPGNAKTITTVARRLDAFPRCAQGLRDGVLSLDQVGVVAQRASEGSDEHYAALAGCATVNQLRTALRLEPRPQPDRRPEPERSVTEITEITDEQSTCWKITLPHIDAAKVDTALQSHLDALVAEWKHDHHDPDAETDQAPPFPTLAEAFLRLVDTSWDTEVARRPHGQHTTVVMHLDVQETCRTGPRACTWARCSPTPNANTWHATPPMRPGSPVTANPSAPAAQHGKSAASFAARWNTDTPPARFPAAAPPAVCTPTTSRTGKTADPPNYPTS